MYGAVDALNLAKAPRLHHHPDHRLVDDRSGATTLGDENFSRRHCEFLYKIKLKNQSHHA